MFIILRFPGHRLLNCSQLFQVFQLIKSIHIHPKIIVILACFQACQHVLKHDNMYSNMLKCAQTCHHVFKHVLKYANTCSNMSACVQVSAHVYKHVLQHASICSSMPACAQACQYVLNHASMCSSMWLPL